MVSVILLSLRRGSIVHSPRTGVFFPSRGTKLDLNPQKVSIMKIHFSFKSPWLLIRLLIKR